MSVPSRKLKTHNRRHHQAPHVPKLQHEEGWLVSYADMMTLLFGLFVMLYSMSNVDKKKYEAMSEAMQKTFMEASKATPVPTPVPTPPPPPPSSLFTKALKEQFIGAGLDSNDVEFIDDGKSLTIALRGNASFESGKTTMLPKGAKFVNDVSNELLKSKLPYEVRIEGHTDDAAISSPIFPTNWELSAGRAAGVARSMADSGIPPERLVVMGLGSSRTLVPNRDVSGTLILANMSKNRRVMIVVAFPDVTADGKVDPGKLNLPKLPTAAPAAHDESRR